MPPIRLALRLCLLSALVALLIASTNVAIDGIIRLIGLIVIGIARYTRIIKTLLKAGIIIDRT